MRRRVRLSVLAVSTATDRLTQRRRRLCELLRGGGATRCSDDGTNTAQVERNTRLPGWSQSIGVTRLSHPGGVAIFLASDSWSQHGAGRAAHLNTPCLATR